MQCQRLKVNGNLKDLLYNFKMFLSRWVFLSVCVQSDFWHEKGRDIVHVEN